MIQLKIFEVYLEPLICESMRMKVKKHKGSLKRKKLNDLKMSRIKLVLVL